MRKFLQEPFVFVERPKGPSENQAAELAIRPLGTARKVFGATRSARGSQTMAVLQTLFGTWSLPAVSIPSMPAWLCLPPPEATHPHRL